MRVLILSWEYPPEIEGGLGRHVAELAPALVQQGVDVDVVTPAGQSTLAQFQSNRDAEVNAFSDVTHTVPAIPGATITVENGVMVHRVLPFYHNNNGNDIYGRVTEVNKSLETYIKHIRRQQPPWDLIHTHDWLTSFAAIALKESEGYPLVTTIHATERGRGRGYLGNPLQHAIDQAERDLIAATDQIIVCSQHMYQELPSFFQTPVNKLSIVPNGVNFIDLQKLPNDNLMEFRARYARPNDQIVFTVSRLVYEKGVHRLVEAGPRIFAEAPLARIIIAGKGPETENLKRQAEYLGIADRINFIGFISDEERNCLFKVANCAVFPSLYEPFGIVALEAMALGCPVVVSDVGGFSEVVTHAENGIRTYPDNADSVAWGVLRALTQPELARKYATKAEQWVQDIFNWQRIALLTREVYHTAQYLPAYQNRGLK